MNNIPLIEKYKPQTLDDIILPDMIRARINTMITNRRCNNLLFVGQSGVGKSLLLHMLGRGITKDRYDDACLNIITAFQRCLKHLTELSPFCEQTIGEFEGKSIPKIVMLDGADNMTKKAQNLISNTIDETGSRVSFIISCNDINSLTSAIRSRCDILYIPPLSSESILSKLKFICINEGIKYEDDGLRVISDNAYGDMRKAINFLDVLRYGYSKITPKKARTLLYSPDSYDIKGIIDLCIEKKLFECYVKITHLKEKGFCCTDILLGMLNVLKEGTGNLSEDIRMKYIDIVSQYYHKMADGLDGDVQVFSCLSSLIV
jgi:replication factor C subunit 2/4